jgi:hypothetical protein
MNSRVWRRRNRSRSAETTPRPDTHVIHEQSPSQLPLSPQMPGSMPRAQDEPATRDKSPGLHDQPGSSKEPSTRYFYF